MDPIARSVRVWGFYALGMGLLLMAVPDLLFAILLVPATDEPWVRVVGVLAFAIGIYYLGGASSAEVEPFARASVAGRLVVTAGIAVVAIVWGYWMLLLIAAVELLSALWTYSLLSRTQAQPQSPTSRADGIRGACRAV